MRVSRSKIGDCGGRGWRGLTFKPLPAPFEDSTTRFSKLIAIRALRDEQQLKGSK